MNPWRRHGVANMNGETPEGGNRRALVDERQLRWLCHGAWFLSAAVHAVKSVFSANERNLHYDMNGIYRPRSVEDSHPSNMALHTARTLKIASNTV